MLSPAAAPDRSRLAGLAERHAAGVRRYLAVLGAGADADDLVQEAFVVLLQRGFVEQSPAATAAFLRATARHLFLRRHRHLLPQVEAADAVWDRHCGDGDGQGYVDALEVCLGRLGARARRLVDACYREDMGRDAIAAELGMSAHGVKTALRRVRAALKACIERRLAR